VGVEVVQRHYDKTWHVNVFINNRPHKSLTYYHPITITEALTLVAVDARLDENPAFNNPKDD